MILFEIGSKCLIDGKTEAVILKSFNKAQTKFIIEIPGTSVQIVERERISPLPAAAAPVPAM
ncbi:hypothetical protein WBG78_22260 [Chryseolinea sp. T2]|uniref:hypothetical protein n=1 Tax=Chryseolinea sp. T2 TaxID=3129255 RepID=UPI0030786FEB